MTLPVAAGAQSIGAALRRIDRRGHISFSLRGPGPLGALAGEPLSALAVDGDGMVAGSALEDALARVEATGGVAAAIDAGVGRPRFAGAAGTAGTTPSAFGLASAGVARRARGSDEVLLRPDRPSTAFGDFATPATRGRLRALETENEPALSRSARLGAATPVRRPVAPALAATDAGAGSPRRPEIASAPPSKQPSALSHVPAARAAEVSGAQSVMAGSAGGPSAAARPAEAALAPVDLSQPTASEPATVREPETARPPAAVAGLSGLVSWWDSQRDPETPGPAADVRSTGRGASFSQSTVVNPERETPRTTEGAFEGSPLVRLSLRSALEELLLAEARAAGIEVYP